MATVVFDFDSTLIPGESLEEAFRMMGLDEKTLAEITDISSRGMAGEVPFKESLRRRLEIARPCRSALERAGEHFADECTKGAPEVIAQLLRDGHHVSVVSGGFKDLINISAHKWGIEPEDVYAVGVHWDAEGKFSELKADGFEVDKVQGLRRAKVKWDGPVFIVGDGVTDAQLKEEGLADYFLAYIEHVSRPVVVEKSDHTVANMLQLRLMLNELL